MLATVPRRPNIEHKHIISNAVTTRCGGVLSTAQSTNMGLTLNLILQHRTNESNQEGMECRKRKS